MNTKIVVYLLALATAFTGSNAQFFERVGNVTSAVTGAFQTVGETAGEVLSNVDCEAEVRATSQCNLAPFSGTFVCREFFSFLGYTSRRSVCARNIIGGVTLGLQNDQCGCCDGACPEPCGCPCGDNDERVWVEVKMVFGLLNFQRCVTQGVSTHAAAWGNAAKCINPTDATSCPSDLSSSEVEEVTDFDQVIPSSNATNSTTP